MLSSEPWPMSGPRKLDSTSLEKVKPQTLATYRAAALKFVNWLEENGYVPDGPEQWGDLLVEYKNDAQLTKCNFEYVVAAVEFVFPRLRRRLAWSHSVIDAWRTAAEVKHAPPLGRAPGRGLFCLLGRAAPGSRPAATSGPRLAPLRDVAAPSKRHIVAIV